MSERTARKLVRFSLLSVMLLGGTVALFGFVWMPVYGAASVDQILNPDELRDPKLIEVVYRTHHYNDSEQALLFWPYRILGTLIIGLSIAGFVGLSWTPSLSQSYHWLPGAPNPPELK
jgi:hypothetical protein